MSTELPTSAWGSAWGAPPAAATAASTLDHAHTDETSSDGSSDEELNDCPLCLEAFDSTDKEFHPCTCGYHICLWCWHNIMESGNQRCPACRSPYQHNTTAATRSLSVSDAAQLLAARASKKRDRFSQPFSAAAAPPAAARKTSLIQATTLNTAAATTPVIDDLSDIRIIQRNLVYVVGLPSNVARSEILQKREYFGRFGKILKIAVARASTSRVVNDNSAKATYAAYVTYKTHESAGQAIKHMDNSTMHGIANPPIRCCLGSTKYCASWLNGRPCTLTSCLYLHSRAKPEDITTKSDLALMWQNDASESKSESSPTLSATPSHAALPTASLLSTNPSTTITPTAAAVAQSSVNSTLTASSLPDATSRHPSYAASLQSDTNASSNDNDVNTPTSQRSPSLSGDTVQATHAPPPGLEDPQSRPHTPVKPLPQKPAPNVILTADATAAAAGIDRRPSLVGTPSVALHITTNYASRLRLEPNHVSFNFSLFHPPPLPELYYNSKLTPGALRPFDGSFIYAKLQDQQQDEQRWIDIIK